MADGRSVSALVAAVLAASAFAGGAVLASHHPIAPFPVLVFFLAWTAWATWRREHWLFAVPAALPILCFAPWTGWLAFDEFDLVVLGAVAAGFARLAHDRHGIDATVAASSQASCRPPASLLLAVLLGASSLAALVRGVADAGGWRFDWYAGYVEPLNSWRVFKGTLYALLAWPMLQRALRRSTTDAIRYWSCGMLVGVGLTALAALYERAAYTGVWDFSAPYRTTALFWEMHVGGGALDAYLALAAPLVAWALWSARSWGRWTLAAIVALLTGYAVLTTFSRGLYLGVAAELTGLASWLWTARRGSTRPAGSARRLAAASLAMCLLMETVVVLAGGSFMLTRFAAGERDFGDRLAHWQRGLHLLAGASDWLWGIGLGRLPAHYAASTRQGEFSGAIEDTRDANGNAGVTVAGPRSVRRLGGLYGISQRVALQGEGSYAVQLRVLAPQGVSLELSVCEMHLLYARRCQAALVHLGGRPDAWQDIDVRLAGPPLTRGDGWAVRSGVFELAVATPGRSVRLGHLALATPQGVDSLANGDFGSGLAHWFPIAHEYFLPWHIDSLWLELLIERGIFGLLVFVLLIACVMRSLARVQGTHGPMAPFLMASLSGSLIVGSLSSIMDTPRVAFLLLMVIFLALQLNEARAWAHLDSSAQGRIE